MRWQTLRSRDGFKLDHTHNKPTSATVGTYFFIVIYNVFENRTLNMTRDYLSQIRSAYTCTRPLSEHLWKKIGIIRNFWVPRLYRQCNQFAAKVDGYRGKIPIRIPTERYSCRRKASLPIFWQYTNGSRELLGISDRALEKRRKISICTPHANGCSLSTCLVRTKSKTFYFCEVLSLHFQSFVVQFYACVVAQASF